MRRSGGPGLAALLAAGLARAGAPDPPEALELRSDTQVERAWDGRPQAFVFAPGATRHARVVVEQAGADVALRLLSPDGELLAEVDDLAASAGPERLAWLAEDDGLYRIEVVPPQRPMTPAGRFVLRLEDVRAGSEADRLRIEGERLLARANRTAQLGTVEASREALRQYEEALPLLRAHADRRAEAEALDRIGEVRFHLGELEPAREAFEAALLAWRELDDGAGMGQELNNLGVVYRLLGEYERAVGAYGEALPLRRAAGDRHGEAQTLSNLGAAHAMLDEYQAAVEHVQAALALRREIGDRGGQAHSLHSLGACSFALGKYEESREYAQQALALRRAVGDAWGEAQALQSLGLAYRALGDVARALDFLGQALDKRVQVGDKIGQASTLHELGDLHAAAGDHARARATLEQALALRREVHDRRGESDTLHALGEVQAALGQREPALQSYAAALALRRTLGDRTGQAQTLLGQARVERAGGRLAEAHAAVEAALDLSEDVRADVPGRDLRGSFTARWQAAYDLQVELLMDLHRREPAAGHAWAALQTSERARARGLRETLAAARSDLRRGLDPELAQAAAQLDQRLRARERVRARLADSPRAGQVEAVAAEIDTLLAERHELEARLRAGNSSYAALTLPPAVGAQQIQALLDPHTLLLEYSLGERRSWLWAVSDTSVEAFELPGRAELESLARRAYDLLQQSRQTAARAAARHAADALAQVVLAPVAERLGRKRRIAVVADGALQYVPFAALPAPHTPALVLEHEVVQLPSVSTLALLREERRAPAGKAVAILADPVLDASDPRVRSGRSAVAGPAGDLDRALADTGPARLERLPYSRREAEAIAALVPPAERLKALDFEASRETALAPALADYRIVHFATHGLLDTRQPELSGVVLSMVSPTGERQDGFLRLRDVYGLALRADLVVLSACRSGLGQEVRGEGLVGLARGFMHAGAGRVLASLWDVRDEATAELMRRFYTAMLRRGLRPAAALRAAQVELQRDPRWAAPFYWAGFVLQGDWR